MQQINQSQNNLVAFTSLIADDMFSVATIFRSATDERISVVEDIVLSPLSAPLGQRMRSPNPYSLESTPGRVYRWVDGGLGPLRQDDSVVESRWRHSF